MMTRRCIYCTTETKPEGRHFYCPSCDLYNAAVTAQKAAADKIARTRYPQAKDAWLNEYGIFAWVDGVTLQVGTPEESAPFVALTRETRKVTVFWERPDVNVPHR